MIDIFESKKSKEQEYFTLLSELKENKYNKPVWFNGIKDLYNLIGEKLINQIAEGIQKERLNPNIGKDFFLFGFYTQIEEYVWEDLRNLSKSIYLPQYPVGKYFLDFADPINKIAIEADGEKWHDKEKDTLRDLVLLKLGWRVFRVKGKHTFKDREFHYASLENARLDLLHSTCGLIWAIDRHYHKSEKAFRINYKEFEDYELLNDWTIEILTKCNLQGIDFTSDYLKVKFDGSIPL